MELRFGNLRRQCAERPDHHALRLRGPLLHDGRSRLARKPVRHEVAADLFQAEEPHVDDDRLPLEPGEKPEMRLVRFRTLGCYPLSGAIESDADSIEDIVDEMKTARVSERQGRLIDTDEAASMEKKKREGYF